VFSILNRKQSCIERKGPFRGIYELEDPFRHITKPGRHIARKQEPGKGKRRAKAHCNLNQIKSGSINSTDNATTTPTNIMGHLGHEKAPKHCSNRPKYLNAVIPLSKEENC